MARTPANTKTLKDRLIGEIKRNPTKAGILGVLMLVLLIVAGRQTLKYLSPDKAEAAPTGGSSSRGEADSGQLGPKARRAATAGPDGARLPSARKPIAKVQRDLFLPDSTFFPPKAVSKPKPKPKPVVTPVDAAAARRKAQRRAVQTEARELTLQTTIVGASPTAIINGQVLGIGGWLNEFQVISINSGTCVVEKKGMRVTLEMMK